MLFCYRHGQSPISRVYPSYEEIKEDLMILKDKFDYIRMYDPSNHKNCFASN